MPPVEGSVRRGVLADVALVAVVIVGMLVAAATLVVRVRLLDPGTYSAALVTADAYDRAYTEVLADPHLAMVTEELIGDLGVGPRMAVQARTLITNAARWVAPPATLQAGSETMIAAVLAYVRGDTDRVDADVAIDDVLGRVDRTAVIWARTLLATAADRAVASLPELERAVAELADELAAGRVPDAVPVLGGQTFDPQRVADAIVAGLGDRATDELRRAVTAAVLAGEQRDAVIGALGGAVTDHAAAAAARLRAESGGRLDVVVELAERARQPSRRIVGTLDDARRAASWFQPLTGVVGALAAAAAAAGLAARHRRTPGRAALAIATALVAAGILNAIGWWLVGQVVTEPLGTATGTGPGSWQLPAGLRAVLGDVRADVGERLAHTVARISGVLVLAGAVTALVVVVGRRRAAAGGSPERVGRAPALGAAAGAGMLLAAVAAGAVVVVVVGTRDPPERACNGDVALCDRRYDDVVFAATHNAMSSPGVVDVWPEHDGDLSAQLDAGVRALLVDSKYWPPVRTVEALAAATDAVEPGVPTGFVQGLFPTLGDARQGRDGTFLCHIHCVFGAVPFGEAMSAVRAFLDDNPDEVVTLIIEDAITPADTAVAMGASGLEPLLYHHRPGEPWPTLGEMIDAGERLVVFAEEEGPPPGWYANAFESMQETPFLFLSPEAFSCAPNRGPDDASLFQMNHWVQRVAPDRADAVTVNALDVLVERARQCERERGLLPNFLAVNFYNIGDVVRAAAVLNDVE